MRPRCLAMLLSLFYTVNIVDLSKLFYWLDSPGSGSFIGWNLSVDWLMWGPWVPHANRRHPFTHAKSFPRQSVARSRPPELAEGRPERPRNTSITLCLVLGSSTRILDLVLEYYTRLPMFNKQYHHHHHPQP